MCIKSCKQIWLYTKLCYNLKKYYNYYSEYNKHNLEILNNITSLIIDCGSIAIKFCQWITPKLELIYLEEIMLKRLFFP